jgi:hypothetical protein
VHLTLGILRTSQAVFYAFSFFQSDGVPPPAPAQVTQTVGRHVLSQKAMKEKSNKIPTESVIRKPDTSTSKEITQRNSLRLTKENLT